MFFMFTFSTLVAIVVTYKLSNAYEKIYGDIKPLDARNELNEEIVDKGDVFTKIKSVGVFYITHLCILTGTLLQKRSYQLSF